MEKFSIYELAGQYDMKPIVLRELVNEPPEPLAITYQTLLSYEKIPKDFSEKEQ